MKLLRIAATIFAVSSTVALGQTATSVPTDERIQQESWWPTKGKAARADYAGDAACTGCHAGIAVTQHQTPMYKAARRPKDAAILQQHPMLPFREADYEYHLALAPSPAHFSVTGKNRSASLPVAWVLGTGEVAQTYLLQQKDSFLEGRLTYYTTLSALDITIGHSGEPPADLAAALGKSVDDETIRRCLGCHTTGSTVANVFDPDHASPGVTCEACHGPGAKHVKGMQSGQNTPAAAAFNPRSLSPVESVDFCGACHRTPADVALETPTDLGIVGLRFQPYRLERSLCWGASGDPRITCVACHDPHKPLEGDSAAYDTKCLACHQDSGHPEPEKAAACKVSRANCASCHMQKYEIPAAHAKFTDHYIRIVRADAGFRN